MRFHPQRRLMRGAGLASALLAAASAHAQIADPAQPQQVQVDELKRIIEQQTSRLDDMRRELAEQEKKLTEIKHALGLETLKAMRGGTGKATTGAYTSDVKNSDKIAQAVPAAAVASESGKDTRPPQVATIFEQPGVLTPRGKFVFDPSIQYSYSSSNRVALVGYTVIPALLIGLIDVREVKRNTFTGTLTARYGLTNRFELEAKLPYVYRSDSSISREVATGPGGTSVDSVFEASGKGIGDVEFAARYQFNDGGLDKPYYIGTLRLKTRTGKDPFEVVTDRTLPGGTATGLQVELPTGSGFFGIQPGVTFLYPSDPAVFFGSLSYLHNIKRTGVVRKTNVGDEELGMVEMGDIFGFNFGMGLALNERSSFSIGYDHSSVGKTKINGTAAAASVRVQLGTLLLGFAYRLNDKTTLNVSVGAGLTRDTPDITLTLRLPTSL